MSIDLLKLLMSSSLEASRWKRRMNRQHHPHELALAALYAHIGATRVQMFIPIFLSCGTGKPACNVLGFPYPSASRFCQNTALPGLALTVKALLSHSTNSHHLGSLFLQSTLTLGNCVPQLSQSASSVTKKVEPRFWYPITGTRCSKNQS